jgi:hypothetical protein
VGPNGNPTTAGGATRDGGSEPSPLAAAAVETQAPASPTPDASPPTESDASPSESAPVTAAAVDDGATPVDGSPTVHASDTVSASPTTEPLATPDTAGGQQLGQGDVVSPETGTPQPATAVAETPEVAVTAVAVGSAPPSVMPPQSTPSPEGPARGGARVAVGPGGGKRRKPGQVDVSIAPEWVPVPAPRPGSFLGGPAIWGVIAIVAVLLAGTVLSNGAFTPFAVDTVDVATNTLTSDTVPIAPGRVQTTSITLGDLTPGTTVVRAPFSVRAEAPGTGKPIAAYVSVVSEKAAPYIRAVIFRCLDANGSPAPCDAAVGFSDARLDTGGTTPLLLETTGGPPASATVRSIPGGDLEILDGAGNVKRGGKVRGVAPVARPTQGVSAKLTDFFVVGGTTGGLGHGAQDVGVNGATATLPMVKGIPGLPPGGQSYLLAYMYAASDTPASEAAAKVGVTIAVMAIGADATP